MKKQTVRVALVADTHFPMINEAVLPQVFKDIEVFGPNRICMLCDMVDFDAIASEKYHPKVTGDKTVLEIEQLKKFTKTLLSICPNVEYLLGNHEARLDRLRSKMPRYPWIEFEQEFTNMGVKMYPVDSSINLGAGKDGVEWVGVHGAYAMTAPGASVTREVQRRGTHVVCGHVHRASFITVRTGIHPNSHLNQGIECPALCLPSKWYTGPGDQMQYANWACGWVGLYDCGMSTLSHHMCLYDN